MGTTDIALERIFRQLVRGNAGRAIAEAETYLAAWPNPQTAEKLKTLTAEYRLMEDYWLRGVSDPQRDEQYRRLLQRVYVVCANIAIHRHLSASSFMQGLSRQVRQQGAQWSLKAIRQEMENFVTDVAMLELEPTELRKEKSLAIHQRHRQQMNNLFNYIVTSRIWTDGVGQEMEEMLLSPTIDSTDQQLLTSAIMLSLMNRFDMVKFRLLVKVYMLSQDKEVQQRALVGWVLSIDDDFLTVYPEQRGLVAEVLRSERACSELTELQMQLVYTLNAERDTATIRDEIMPDLLKNNQFRMTPTGLEEMEDDHLEDVLHPEAAEQRMEKLEATFQRMMNMQKQGADIYFGGFSQMKRFPFFYDMSNWLVPFYMQHPDIAQYVERLQGNRLVEVLVKNGLFCNSDRYSLVMSMQQMMEHLPESIRELLQRKELSLEELEVAENPSPAFARRLYLMDLYRFFRLFPNRAALFNPFDTAKGELGMCMFFTSKLFMGTPLERYKSEIVTVLLKRNLKQTARQLLETFPERMHDVQYYLWTGDYAKALELEPDNERALNGHARKAFEQGYYDVALESYEHLLLQHPDKTGYKLNKAVCMISMEDYEDAIPLLYQLNFEQPENAHVTRVLAWALTCSGRQEQANRFYEELAGGEHPLAEDLLNRGYCLWLQGRVNEAAESFRKYMERRGDQGAFVVGETRLLSGNGITVTDINMMEALVGSAEGE